MGELGYYTHRQDPNLDLLQLGVRFYDPETGRFTQADPARDGVNWYAYVGNRPSTCVGPEGLRHASIGDGSHVHFPDKCIETCMKATCVDQYVTSNAGKWVGGLLGGGLAGLGGFIVGSAVCPILGTWYGACALGTAGVGMGMGAGELIDNAVEGRRKKALCEAYCRASASNHGGIADMQCRNFQCWYENTYRK